MVKRRRQVLEITRWKQRDEEGFSWWLIKIKDTNKIRLPKTRNLQQLFRRSCPRSRSDLKVHRVESDRHIFVGMQIGLKKADREAFIKELEAKIKV